MSQDTLTHMAGEWLCISGRYIQRCCICGAKLVDTLNQAQAIIPGQEPKAPVWPIGGFIQVEPGNPTRYSVIPDPSDITKDGDTTKGKLPDDICTDFI